METTIRYIGGVQFEIEARGHRAICDQPVESGGEDAGMNPPEFLLASLGTCAGYYAAQYLKTRSLPMNGLSVRVHAEKAAHPARLSSFRIEVTVPELEARHIEGVNRAVKSCLVHNTLLNTPAIEIAIEPATTKVAAGESGTHTA